MEAWLMAITVDDIAENFDLLGDWEERYKYVIELGDQLPPMDNALKTDATKVRGCTSQVWMVAKEEDGVFTFLADSDAHIVRGLVAILLIAYNGKTVAEIQAFPIEEFFKQLGLDKQLSPNRRNGFVSMVDKIRQLSQEAA